MIRVASTLLLFSATASAQEINRYLYPTETRLVAIFDLQGARQSGFFDEQIRSGFDRLLESNDQVRKLSQILSFDPSKRITGFTVCGGGGGRNRSYLLIINGEFPYQKFSDALVKLANDGELTSLEINDLPVYFEHRARRASYFAIVDRKTLIATPSKSWLKDAVEGLTELREPSEELSEQLGWKSNEFEPVVNLAGFFPEEARRRIARVSPLADIAEELVAYNFVAYLEKTPRFRLRLTMTEASVAEEAATIFETMVNFAKIMLAESPREDLREILEKLSIKPKDQHLMFDIKIEREMFEQMIEASRNRRENRPGRPSQEEEDTDKDG